MGSPSITRLERLGRELVALSTLCALVAGCSANFNSIYRGKDVPTNGGRITLIDAKQRAIISSVIDDPTFSNAQQKRLVICAEASPDVFSVYANALSAGASLDKSGDPTSLGIAGNLSYSSAETGATIPRTATITALREMMYRTCERYLMGAISKLELPIQAARDQHVLIAALAIKGLTGAVRQPTVVVRAGGTSSSGSSGSGGAEKLATAREDVKKAESDEGKKQKALDDLNAAEPKCTAKEIDDAANSTKKKSCAIATTELAAAKKSAADAREHYSNMIKAVESGSIPTSASASGEGSVGVSGSGPSEAALQAVSGAVKEIVIKNYEQPEFLFFCLKLFNGTDFPSRGDGSDVRSDLYGTCLRFVEAGINAEGANYTEIAR